MTTTSDEQLAAQRARSEAITKAGKRWIEVKSSELASLDFGTVVIFDVETGEYVTGATRLEAMDAYDRTIGPHRPGFMHQIGKRIFLGGGLFG